MKKSYIIFPIILMAIFGYIYKNFTVENAIKEGTLLPGESIDE